jgi:alginate O-acetyltransferase complex protein AlgI
MSFVSLAWLGWMAGAAGLFWATPARLRAWAMPAITLVFLLVWSPASAALLLGVIALCWFPLAGVARPSARQAGLPAAAIVALFVGLRALDQAPSGVVGDVVMPLGFAYYLLRCMHYLLERYKGTLPPHGLAELAQYLLFLPTLVVGPIHRFPAFLMDNRRHRWNGELASEGLERVVLGYARIVILGSFLLGEVGTNRVAELAAAAPWLGAWAEIVRYALSLYVQFAGYSDVAIGFALICGYRVMENFDSPFLKANLSEFWASWHISLTSFVRENLYMVVIATTRRPALAAVASMVAIGVWHELSWRYLLWGAWHGGGIALWQWHRQAVAPRLPALTGLAGRVADVASVLLTFHFVALGFTLVRGDTPDEAIQLFRTLFFLEAR